MAKLSLESMSNCYAFRMPGHRENLALVAELMLAERDCPFLKFELTGDANMGPLVLRVTGSGGTREFLNSILT